MKSHGSKKKFLAENAKRFDAELKKNQSRRKADEEEEVAVRELEKLMGEPPLDARKRKGK